METTTNPIVIKKLYHAPRELVWEAITNRTALKEWYFDFDDNWKLEAGTVFEWKAGPPDGEQWLHRGKMIEIIPGKKLSQSWEYPGYSGTSTVTWELKKIDAQTTELLFTHAFHVPFDPTVEALRKEHFMEGWNDILYTGLVDYLKITPEKLT